MGRFTSPDPRNIVDEQGRTSFIEYLADPQNWNHYSYVLNNPVRTTDPDGRQPNKSQAGTVQQVIAIVYSIQRANPGASGRDLLRKVDQHFRNQVDEPGAVRYVYTKESGWLDMKHFFAAANTAAGAGEAVTNAAGLFVELQQTVRNDESAFSYEDVGSNAAGANFGDDVCDPAQGLTGQLNEYLNSLNPTDPSAAPNWPNVPREPGLMDGSRVQQSIISQTPPSSEQKKPEEKKPQ